MCGFRPTLEWLSDSSSCCAAGDQSPNRFPLTMSSTASFVDRLVDEHVVKMFSEISDLVSIRYKELDRVTSHGLHPLPEDSSLSGLLRPSASETTDPRSDTSGSE